jgi:AcrR family transcriptional regulator
MGAAVPDAGATRRQQRRVQRQDLSRTQLLDAAEEVFGRKGFHDTTLKEVAERAGFSVGSVYSFFESKDDLIRQVYRRRGDEFMPALHGIIESTGSEIEILHQVVTFQVEFFRSHPHFGRLYLWHSGRVLGSDGSAPLDETTAARLEEALGLQADLFARGQRAGLLRSGDPAALSRMFSGLIGAYQEMDPATTSDDPDATELFPLADLHDLITRAFSTEGAR